MYFGATQSAWAFTLAAVVRPIEMAGEMFSSDFLVDVLADPGGVETAGADEVLRHQDVAVPTHPVPSSRLLSLYSAACATRN